MRDIRSENFFSGIFLWFEAVEETIRAGQALVRKMCFCSMVSMNWKEVQVIWRLCCNAKAIACCCAGAMKINSSTFQKECQQLPHTVEWSGDISPLLDIDVGKVHGEIFTTCQQTAWVWIFISGCLPEIRRMLWMRTNHRLWRQLILPPWQWELICWSFIQEVSQYRLEWIQSPWSCMMLQGVCRVVVCQKGLRRLRCREF